MNVLKRNGTEVQFDRTKILFALQKANTDDSIPEAKRLSLSELQSVTDKVVNSCEELGRAVGIEEIQNLVEDGLMKLCSTNPNACAVARGYTTYRYTHTLKRQQNTTDERILTLISCQNEEAKQENSNKNPTVVSVQRDYMAGEVSRDLTERILVPKDIMEAHKNGLIHFHDSDYYARATCSATSLKR